MRAYEARQLTKKALDKHSLLVSILGKITEAAIDGKSWVSWKKDMVEPYTLEFLVQELEELGYEINFQTGDYIQIEW